MDFEGKVAIVSGAGAAEDGIGNGRATALLLARRGAHVVVVDRREQAGQGTVDMILGEGGQASLVVADVTTAEDCERIATYAVDAAGRIDVLVNNVGIGSRGSVLTTDREMWDRVMRINVASMYEMSRAALPTMAANGGGAIVNTSSISALLPRGLTAYSTSKGAVIALTKAMAVDHANDGIRVNCVAPGPVLTPMVGGEGMDPTLRENRVNASLLKTEGTGWDVGNAIVFLASDDARYITGQTLIVDGGVTLKGPGRNPS